MTNVTEIAPDLFRLSIYVPELDLQFNHFLVRDEQPLLFHAGLKGMHPPEGRGGDVDGSRQASLRGLEPF